MRNRRSLSARRAWIEIVNEVWANFSGFVALRKESVDRNHCRCYPCNTCYRSLSARRAWIEIFFDVSLNYKEVVALRKESVDRNTKGDKDQVVKCRRSPQGERG